MTKDTSEDNPSIGTNPHILISQDEESLSSAPKSNDSNLKSFSTGCVRRNSFHLLRHIWPINFKEKTKTQISKARVYLLGQVRKSFSASTYKSNQSHSLGIMRATPSDLELIKADTIFLLFCHC